MDKKLAEAVRAEIIRSLAKDEGGIVRKAVMAVDNPHTIGTISTERINEAFAYFANFFDTIRFETAVGQVVESKVGKMVQVTFIDNGRILTLTRAEFDKQFGVKEGVEILAGYDPTIHAVEM
jgi:hypothetical protein